MLTLFNYQQRNVCAILTRRTSPTCKIETWHFSDIPCCLFKMVKVKVKDHLRTGYEGPEVEQMYSSTLPSTSTPDGGRWSTPRPDRFTPGKDPVPIVQEAGWDPGPVWTGVEKSRPPPGFHLRAVQPVASRYPRPHTSQDT